MFIKRPGGMRRSYALVLGDGKTLHDPRIDKVNEDLRAGVAVDLLEARMQAIRQSFAAPRMPLAVTNERLVEERHRWKLKWKPTNVDPEGLRQTLLSAARAVGDVPLREASADQILDALRHITDLNKRQWVVRGINELLRHAKRGFIIPNAAPPRLEEIEYIRAVEFIVQASRFERDVAAYLGALFATGCRWGELAAARLTTTEAKVTAQIDDEGRRRQTKNKKSRTAPVLPPLVLYVERFLQLPRDRVLELRLKHQRSIRDQVKAVYGIRVHSLRHSYAVEWGAVGTPVEEIADYIGDTVAVCKDRYRNYCATPDQINRALSRFK